MTQDNEGFLKRLLATFKVEAQEHLAAMSQLLLELERPAAAAETAQRVETLFREAHSLKGAARSVNLADIEHLCQALERVLSALKREQLALVPAMFDTLYATLDALGQLLARDVDGKGSRAAVPLAALVVALDRLLHAEPQAPLQPPVPVPARPAARTSPEAEPTPPVPPTSPTPAAATGDTVRIATDKLESLLAQAEDLHAHKFSGSQLADELQDVSRMLADWKRDWDKRGRHARATRRSLSRPGLPWRASAGSGASAPAQRQLQQLLEAVDPDELFAKSLADRLARIERLATQERRALAGKVDKLLDGMKQALMLPFASLLESVPKLVRDLAHDCGKELELATHGPAIEVDRRILEQLKTPLVHLIRNAVDHGIEAPDERVRAGKPKRGRIDIRWEPRGGGKVELEVADDGAGISPQLVRAAAEKSGLRSAQVLQAMNEQQLLALVFESGLSTSPILTSLSGHGLGLAIVREKIERLGGSITLASTPGQGTRFTMLLPNTLAAFRGLLVMSCDRAFVLPTRNVERVGRVKPSQIRIVDERETIVVDDQTLPLARLHQVLALPGVCRGDADNQHIAVLASGGRRVAFAVDEVIGDQEVLVKPLGAPLRRVRHVAAATVFGAGQVVPLLNVEDLMTSAVQGRRPPTPRPHAAARRLTLMVAEDSVTTRVQLKHLLESAGYDVSTAADGMEALTALRAGRFDLLVSDVEMPRMDGFDLTTRLRADPRLAELPVVLVTALESRADKERGVDAGANAYVVKSGFDPARLLDIIRTLV